MLNLFRDTSDPIIVNTTPRSEEVASLDARPAELLAVLYGRLLGRMRTTRVAIEQSDPDAVRQYAEVQSLISQLRACLDPNVTTSTIRHMRALLSHIAERLALSDDWTAALDESEKLIAPVSDALVELAESYAAMAQQSQTARVLHS